MVTLIEMEIWSQKNIAKVKSIKKAMIFYISTSKLLENNINRTKINSISKLKIITSIISLLFVILNKVNNKETPLLTEESNANKIKLLLFHWIREMFLMNYRIFSLYTLSSFPLSISFFFLPSCTSIVSDGLWENSLNFVAMYTAICSDILLLIIVP